MSVRRCAMTRLDERCAVWTCFFPSCSSLTCPPFHTRLCIFYFLLEQMWQVLCPHFCRRSAQFVSQRETGIHHLHMVLPSHPRPPPSYLAPAFVLAVASTIHSCSSLPEHPILLCSCCFLWLTMVILVLVLAANSTRLGYGLVSLRPGSARPRLYRLSDRLVVHLRGLRLVERNSTCLR